MLGNGNFIKGREQAKIGFIKSCKYDQKNGNKQVSDIFVGTFHGLLYV